MIENEKLKTKILIFDRNRRAEYFCTLSNTLSARVLAYGSTTEILLISYFDSTFSLGDYCYIASENEVQEIILNEKLKSNIVIVDGEMRFKLRCAKIVGRNNKHIQRARPNIQFRPE